MPARKGALPVHGAWPRRDPGAARAATWPGSATASAPTTGRDRCCSVSVSRSTTRWPRHDDEGDGRQRRPRHRRRVQLAARRTVRACCRAAAASARSTPRRSAGRSRCSIARRCCSDEHVDAAASPLPTAARLRSATNGFWAALNDRDDAALAGAVLHRGQRLRHFGDVRVPDAGRQHRGESRVVPQSRRSWRAIGADPRARRRDDRERRSRACAAARARCCCGCSCPAPVGSFRPGHAGLQVGGRDRRGDARAIRSRGCASSWCRRRSAKNRGARSNARAMKMSQRALGTRRATPAARRRSTSRAMPSAKSAHDGAIDCSSRAACCAKASQPRDGTPTVHAGGRAHQHADGDPAHARARAARQSAHARVRRGRRPQGRRACGDARACRTSSARRACSIPACRKRASSARAVGMALAGLMPVPEIQFRKYADPAAEQLNDCGTMRWRTANRFAAPMVVRMPGGFFKCGDPWHSQTQRGAVRARDRLARGDAVQRGGRGGPAALGAAWQRSDDLLRAPRDARRRLGAASLSGRRVRRAVRQGADAARQATELTIVTLGRDGRALRARRRGLGCRRRVARPAHAVPWDRAAVLASVRKTRRCLIVHEDNADRRLRRRDCRDAGAAMHSSTSTRRSSGSRCRTCRARTVRCCSTPWCPSVARIVQAIRTIASV